MFRLMGEMLNRYKFVVLGIIIVVGLNILLVIGRSSPDYYSEVRFLVYVLWLLTFLPALIVLARAAWSRQTKDRKWLFKISIFWLLFLYLSNLSMYFGREILNQKFLIAIEQSNKIIEAIKRFEISKGRYPLNLDELFNVEGPLDIPEFAPDRTFYMVDQKVFYITLFQPAESGIFAWGHWVMFDSVSQRWGPDPD